MYESTLQKAGLTESQAKIYEVVLKQGLSSAGEISQASGLKRGLTYKVLEELEALQLIQRIVPKKGVASFEPCHPVRLTELAEEKEKQAKNAQVILRGVLEQLTSDFNLISERPGVLFYEGKEAVKKIAADSLTASGEILSYIDNEALDKYWPKENKAYVHKRIERNIKKRLISPDTPYTRKIARDFCDQLIEARVIPVTQAFETVTQIYGNKVSFLTLGEKATIGIIVDDAHITKMHRTIFEYVWSAATPIT
jgi:sugar-specific transcriptional regulator TrmB